MIILALTPRGTHGGPHDGKKIRVNFDRIAAYCALRTDAFGAKSVLYGLDGNEYFRVMEAAEEIDLRLHKAGVLVDVG